SSVAFNNTGTVNVDGGTLQVQSSFTNQGTVRIASAGVVNIVGNFVNSSSALVESQIGGTANGQFGRIAVSGTAGLSGTFTAILADGFLPVAGNSFSVLTFASRTGDFTTVNGLSLPNGLIFNRTFSGTAMTLTVAAPLMAAEAPLA